MNSIREIKSALIQILYWAIRVAAFPLLVFYFLYRCSSRPRYCRRFSERLGGEPASFHPTPPGAIWLHAVSVGEVVSAAGLLREIRERSPSIPLYVSVTTVAGREIAEERLNGLVDGIFYVPIDYAFAVRHVLARIRPSAVVILETEIWPVLYCEVKRAGCSLLVVNGRISDRAFPRYRRWRFLFEDALRRPDAILVQSDQDAARYLELGAPAYAMQAIGNLKYDAEPSRAEPPRDHLGSPCKAESVSHLDRRQHHARRGSRRCGRRRCGVECLPGTRANPPPAFADSGSAQAGTL